MISASIAIVNSGRPPRLRATLFAATASFLVLVGCVAGVGCSLAATPEAAKEPLITSILKQFVRVYSLDRNSKGRTFTVVLKRFEVDDEQTYAIIEEDETFWVIALPALAKRNVGVAEPLVGQEFPLGKVRPELIAQVRENPVIRQFVVPSSPP